MAYRKDKTTVAQTAANTAASLAAQFVASGLIGTIEEADAYFDKRYADTFAKLGEVVAADNEVFAAAEASEPAKPRKAAAKATAPASGNPGDVLFTGGKFKGVSIAEVYAMSEAEAKDTYGHSYGAGDTYIKNYSATEKNTNDTTREASKQFLASL